MVLGYLVQYFFLGHSELVTKSFQVLCVLVVCVLDGMLVLAKFSLDGSCALCQNRNCDDNENLSYEDKSTASNRNIIDIKFISDNWQYRK
jgi:hypothetical protein